jgi:hypothetical protein
LLLDGAIVEIVPQPPTKLRNSYSSSEATTPLSGHSEWIIVAPKDEADVVDHILQRAPADGIQKYRVLWSDGGPIKFYSSAEELWRDAFAN